MMPIKGTRNGKGRDTLGVRDRSEKDCYILYRAVEEKDGHI